MKILVVEDDKNITELIAYNLRAEGHEVLVAATGEAGLGIAQREKPDIMILDLMLPGIDGYQVCRRVRQNEELARLPILMLTARTEEQDQVSGLEMGADDFMTKPFSPKVLSTRIKALVRRQAEPVEVSTSPLIQIHGIRIDPHRYEVTVNGTLVNLSATEFAILKHLASNPGWVFSRNQIIDAVRGDNYPVTERSVDVQILGLRKKLLDQGRYVETVRGVGYRMKGSP